MSNIEKKEKNLNQLIDKLNSLSLSYSQPNYEIEKIRTEKNELSRQKSENSIEYSTVDESVLRQHLLIINASPVGTFPKIEEAPNLPYQGLTKDHILFDLIYNPLETQFLKEGKARGCKLSNGLKMLEYQAEKSWEIWNQ